MDKTQITAQIIGIIAMAFMIASFQIKSNRRLLIAQGIGGILCEVFCLSSIIISFIRYGKDGFEK